MGVVYTHRDGRNVKAAEFRAALDVLTDAEIAALLAVYLPLAGGTLTGALAGTSATFSGAVAVGSIGGVAISGGNILTAGGTIQAANLTGTTAITGGTIAGTTGTFSGAGLFGGKITTTVSGVSDSQIKAGSFEIQSYGVNNAWLCDNLYYAGSGGSFTRRATGYGGVVRFINGDIQFETAASGTAASLAAPSVRLGLLNTGAFGIGGTIAGLGDTSGATIKGDASQNVTMAAALTVTGTATVGGLTTSAFVSLGGIIMSQSVLFNSSFNMHLRPGGNAASSVIVEGPAGADAGTGNAFKFLNKAGIHATATGEVSVRNYADSADAAFKCADLYASGNVQLFGNANYGITSDSGRTVLRGFGVILRDSTGSVNALLAEADLATFSGNVIVGNGDTNPTVQFGGTSSSFPMFRRFNTALQCRLADGSGYAPFLCSNITAFGNADVTGYLSAQRYLSALITKGAVGATETIDWTAGSDQTIVLDDNCVLSFTDPGSSVTSNLILRIQQDATGSRTVTWPASVRWAGGVAPTLTTTATRFDIFEFWFDGTYYIGRVWAQDVTL